MSNIDYEIKLSFSNLCKAMVRNINNNFRSISFEIMRNGDIQVKIILFSGNEADLGLIDDLIGELASMSAKNNVLKPIVSTNAEESHLNYLVYQSYNFDIPGFNYRRKR